MSTRMVALLLFMAMPLVALSQSAELSFHTASNQYIHEKNREALSTVQSALQRYPNDPKLKALAEKIKEEQKKEQQQQEQQKINEDGSEWCIEP